MTIAYGSNRVVSFSADTCTTKFWDTVENQRVLSQSNSVQTMHLGIQGFILPSALTRKVESSFCFVLQVWTIKSNTYALLLAEPRVISSVLCKIPESCQIFRFDTALRRTLRCRYVPSKWRSIEILVSTTLYEKDKYLNMICVQLINRKYFRSNSLCNT